MAFDPDSDSAFASGNQREARNYVKFYRQWVRNNFKSQQEGREVGEEQDFILIISPGNSKTEVRRKATDADKYAYGPEWSAYLQGKEHQVSGTPIELLPGLANGMADALKALYIYTIEQMASLPDIALQKVGMGGNEIRQKCRAYLSRGSAEVETLKQQLAEAQARIAILEAQQDRPERTAPKRAYNRKKHADSTVALP
jgi:hypothetical protein